MRNERVVVVSGGVGAARLLRGFHRSVDELTAIANVGDDMTLHGLQISPDLDTIVYTLADAVSSERGWGLEGETWKAMEMVTRYGGEDWFSLGDRDLGTHLFRTQRLSEGATLAEATAEIVRGWDLHLRLLPVSNDRLRTMVTIDQEGARSEISFQEYFVGRQHDVDVTAVRFDGASSARPAPGVLDAITAADRVVVAPSNPLVSIDPVLSVAGVRSTLAARRESVVGVSPIIAGAALKGPAARLMTEMGLECSAVGVARYYADFCGTMVIDTVDAALAADIEALGVRCIVTDTIMSEPGVLDSLCETLLH